MPDQPLEALHDSIKNIPLDQRVPDLTVFVAQLNPIIAEVCGIPSPNIYMTARALKHVQVKRPNYDYRFIIRNIREMLINPDLVYENLPGKRGQLLFVKKMDNDFKYACSIELTGGLVDGKAAIFITTAFRNSKDSYFERCNLLWSREDGTPPSL